MTVAFLGEAVRRARKEHACFWCREPIAIGEQFRESRVAEDGRLDTWRIHPECDRAEMHAYSYNQPLYDEPSCLEVDIDGGRHKRGQNCRECSETSL